MHSIVVYGHMDHIEDENKNQKGGIILSGNDKEQEKIKDSHLKKLQSLEEDTRKFLQTKKEENSQ